MVYARVNAPVSVSREVVLSRPSALHPIQRDGDGGFFYALNHSPHYAVLSELVIEFRTEATEATEKTEKEAAYGRHS